MSDPRFYRANLLKLAKHVSPFWIFGIAFCYILIANYFEGSSGLQKFNSWDGPKSSHVLSSEIPKKFKRLKRHDVSLEFKYTYKNKHYHKKHEFVSSFIRGNPTKYDAGKSVSGLRINPENPDDFFIYSRSYSKLKKSIVWILIPLFVMFLPVGIYFFDPRIDHNHGLRKMNINEKKSK